MFWLCASVFPGTGRPDRFWIVNSEVRPDEPDEDGYVEYPFNDMGGYVVGSYASWQDADLAIETSITEDATGFVQWRD